jgi:hypothetical protein
VNEKAGVCRFWRKSEEETNSSFLFIPCFAVPFKEARRLQTVQFSFVMLPVQTVKRREDCSVLVPLFM